MTPLRSHWTCHRAIGCLVLAAGLLVLPAVLAAAPAAAPAEGGSLVADIDLRPAFVKWGLGPRIQGKRNTCSVFTVAGALEYAMATRDGRGTRLSVEFLNWASNQVLHDAQDGGFFSDLWQGFALYGACPEQDMPYQDAFDPNRAPSQDAKDRAKRLREVGFRIHWIKPWNRETGLTEQQFLVIKDTLHRKWPVCAGLRWPKQVRWTNDVLETAKPEDVFDGHSVLIVGTRDDPALAGGGGLLFRNTNHNGRDGWMTYDYARTYMNDALWIDCGK